MNGKKSKQILSSWVREKSIIVLDCQDCDVNDAFFGLSERRAKFIALSWVMGILALFGAGMTFLGLGRFNEITGTGIVVGICFLLLAIELTVKSSIEKKEATDEES